MYFFHVVLSAGNSYNLNCCIVCAKTLMNRILQIILYLLLYYVVVFSFSYVILFFIMSYSKASIAGRKDGLLAAFKKVEGFFCKNAKPSANQHA